ncbi:hypothetical protein SAMN04244553_3444 [Nocardia amikacinitolerans]|uniref:Uncharacterized protein n=1 Tax=Nocardia amikacinitolerans TaxID=756689 RepID=A0A285LEX2_9NOCA|nr:hypothetical protein SAMN04244553_3444 [Nocardia amikacinitolerans]
MEAQRRRTWHAYTDTGYHGVFSAAWSRMRQTPAAADAGHGAGDQGACRQAAPAWA